MKVALIQTHLTWENPQKNLQHFEHKIQAITQAVDLIILPEMFTTGFTMTPVNLAQTMQGNTLQWLKKMAYNKASAITGSIIIKEEGNYYNRLLFVTPEGTVHYYDKKHLFSLANEDKVYTAGNEKTIVTYKNWRICLQICYDLRFPVFARNTHNYDLLLYVASWPESRINAWDILLRARAIENLSYVIGVNRIGIDGNNHHYNGHSQAIDFLGNYLQPPINTCTTAIVELDKQALNSTRHTLNFLNDQDLFTLL